jgi:hypothetical protein
MLLLTCESMSAATDNRDNYLEGNAIVAFVIMGAD